MTTPLDTMLAAHGELPSRHPVTILSVPMTVSRPSRGHDARVALGSVVRSPTGYGIATAMRKERHGDEWYISVDIAPPSTDSQRDAIARVMACRWDESLAAVMMGAPDDERLRAQHEGRRDLYCRLRERLVQAGLLS